MAENNELWTPARRIENAFRRSLLVIADKIIASITGLTDTSDIRSVLEKLTRSSEFRRFTENAARKMVTGLFADNGRIWRQAAAANGKSRQLYNYMQRELKGTLARRMKELIKHNTSLIRTLPLDIATDVTAYVTRESEKGRRASDIAKEIQKMFPSHTRARAELIARTQTSMAQMDITRARAEKLGVNWYVWRSVGGAAGDGRTRYSHKKMSHVLVNWNDPPAPEDLFPTFAKNGKRHKNTLGHYHAGCCPNCRCYAEPVVLIDRVEFPCRIYSHGRIFKITKKEFEKGYYKK